MGKLIFVVDDQIGIRLLMKEILKTEDYNVKEFDTAQAALQASLEWSPSLLFVDYNMPIMNGADLAKRLYDQDKSIPLVLMTGYAKDELDGDLSLSNIKEILHKPFDVTEVLSLAKRFAR
ncbi:response regulator [Salirhabdus sp. Marseille-P4669]|uniref:response regulator n=1 Tax=Salirhabdus sp. Marseille-P4669 TaxID=2042310 RepID=UPI000C7E5FCD|nr:response regulator [Salirhabdus sp. Marseille-P4669]